LFALVATNISCIGSKLIDDLLRYLFRISTDADRDLLGKANTVWVDIDLNDLRVFWPIIDTVAG
jgi:hypothetical protein